MSGNNDQPTARQKAWRVLKYVGLAVVLLPVLGFVFVVIMLFYNGGIHRPLAPGANERDLVEQDVARSEVNAATHRYLVGRYQLQTRDGGPLPRSLPTYLDLQPGGHYELAGGNSRALGRGTYTLDTLNGPFVQWQSGPLTGPDWEQNGYLTINSADTLHRLTIHLKGNPYGATPESPAAIGAVSVRQ
ncbi:MAG: hypothetical protein ACRYFX_22935 [Janthinobacterium lividum]